MSGGPSRPRDHTDAGVQVNGPVAPTSGGGGTNPTLARLLRIPGIGNRIAGLPEQPDQTTLLPTRVGPAEGTTEATISLPSLPDGREGMWLVTVEASALVEASFPAPIVTGQLYIAGITIDLTFIEDEIATKVIPPTRGAFVALTSDSPSATSGIGVSSPTGAVSIVSSAIRLDAYLIRPVDF